MLRLYVKSRPYLVGGALLFLATYNASNALRVPMSQVPAEVYDRYLSRVEADAPAEELRREADQGGALAAYFYGLRHSAYCPRDLRIKADAAVALAYFQKAVELSSRPRAKAVLALYYLNGWGAKPDPTRAEKLAQVAEAEVLAQAAKAGGQPLGYCVAGEIHLQRARARQKELEPPDGPKLDAAVRAKKLAELAAEAKAALENLTFAADRQNARALRVLAEIYDQGDLGRPRNHRMATECYQRAALRRDERAARTLAERFSLGDKVERDLKLAYAWTLVEAQLAEENTEPRRRRDELEKRLTVAEKLAAQDQATQWLAQMPSEEDTARARLEPDR